MKYRAGFVSNSSSSSFLIADEGVTTAEIAINMLRTLKREGVHAADEEEDKWYKRRHKKLQDTIDLLEANEDFDGPIMFKWSCNYDTYIWHVPAKEREYHQWGSAGMYVKQLPKGIFVETCNNDPWELRESYNKVDSFPEGDEPHHVGEDSEFTSLHEQGSSFYIQTGIRNPQMSLPFMDEE